MIHPLRASIAQRMAALEAAFRRIRSTRMSGVPVLHPGLRVQAVGFEDDADGALCGVLLTPWFMSLLRMPLQPLPEAQASWLDLGCKGLRHIGETGLEFIGACEPGLGVFETCSLFSPMFQFADHAAALTTATAVLQQLRQSAVVVAPVQPTVQTPMQTPMAIAATEPVPSRRGFLFGRGTAVGAAR